MNMHSVIIERPREFSRSLSRERHACYPRLVSRLTNRLAVALCLRIYTVPSYIEGTVGHTQQWADMHVPLFVRYTPLQALIICAIPIRLACVYIRLGSKNAGKCVSPTGNLLF